MGFRDPTIGTKNRHRNITEDADAIEAAFRAACENSFEAFYRGILIKGQDVGVRMFDRIGADFQRRCFADMTSSIEALRQGDMPPCRRFWIERTKKASKDADLAVIVVWLIAFPLRPFLAQIGAADSEQAGIVKERIGVLLEMNPWLGELVELTGNQIRSKKKGVSGLPLAVCKIEAADIKGAHGGTPDLLVINELSHITKWEFAETLMHNANGVARGIVIIATNAGFIGTKPHVWRINALKMQTEDQSWQVHVWDQPAPWHDRRSIRDEKAMMTRGAYQRLWHGRWASGKGDALDEDKLNAMFLNMHGPVLQPEPGWEYVIGVDLGVKHDHSGVVVVGINYNEQLCKTAIWKRWKPIPGSGKDGGIDEVRLQDVQSTILHWYRLYRANMVFFDPSQALLMIQQLQRQGVICAEMPFIASKLTAMAESFRSIVSAGKILAYDDAEHSLRAEFGKFNIVEKPYGVKLEAVSDESGHADVGTALIITMPYVRDALNGSTMLQPGESLTYNETKPLTAEEVKAAPDELRDIILMNNPGGLVGYGIPDTRKGIIGKDQNPVVHAGPDKDIDDDGVLNAMVDWYGR